jgi:hypothetical protein
MKRIRVRVILLATWLVFLFVLDRALDPISISNISVGLIFIILIATLGFSNKAFLSLWGIVIFPIIVLFVTKYLTGKLLGDLSSFLAIIEAFILVMTAILARWVSLALGEFETSVAKSILGRIEDNVLTTLAGQGSIYREVRRARNHQRPLALVSIGVEEKSLKLIDEEMIRNIQLSMLTQYKLQGLSKLLCNELEDCAVIVKETDRFLAVLPETKPEELPTVLERLRQKASTQIGINLKIGVANLPNDSYTFEGLVERATQAMQSDMQPESYYSSDSQPVESRIT